MLLCGYPISIFPDTVQMLQNWALRKFGTESCNGFGLLDPGLTALLYGHPQSARFHGWGFRVRCPLYRTQYTSAMA
jgi:hypothetical protein